MSAERRLIEAAKKPSAALDYEIAQEIASALGRMGRNLEQALARLAIFDQAVPGTESAPQARQLLVNDARKALWQFIVQRESCGLRDTRQVMADYRVPVEVQHAVAVPPAMRRPPKVRG